MPGQTIQDVIRESARKHGVPEAFALAVAEKESSFNPEAIGPDIPTMPGVRARGTFQLLPDTAKRLGVDPEDHFQNIDGGVKYLRELLDASQGDLDLTLKTYGGFKTKDPTPYITDITERMAKFGPGGAVSAAAAPPPASPAGRPVATGRASGAGPAATTPPGMDVTTDPVSGVVSTMGELFVKPYDPRTPEGRRNLAGLGGEVAISRIPGLGVVAPEAGQVLSNVTRGLNLARRTIVPALGAGIGAGTEVAVENAFTDRNLSDLIVDKPVDDPLRIAAEQALYSVGGQAVMWPIRRAGKLVLGARIGKAAEAGVKAEVAGAREAGTRAVSQVRDKVAEGLEAARILERANQAATKANLQSKIAAAKAAAAAQVGAAETRGAYQTVGAKVNAAMQLAKTELDNTDMLQTFTKEYDNLLANPPSVGGTVEAARTVLEGPAKRALEMAGQRVEEAAASGPMINVAPLRKTIEGLIKQKRPASIFEQGGKSRVVGFGPSAVREAQAGVKLPAATTSGGKQLTPDEIRSIQAEVAKQLGVAETHPLPGVIGKIMTISTDQIPFKEAHQIKRLLDEAVNWDRAAKKHLEAMTKGTRIALREELAVHEPYNVATAAYHALVPIYRKGIGKRLSSALMNNPDAAARLLKSNDPIQAQTLKDLLVTQAAAGGDSKAGQMAWDMVRAQFTYDRLIKGGAEGLQDRVRNLIAQHPEFVKVIADDDNGKQVLQNLANLGAAVNSAKELAAQRLAATKATGKAAVSAVEGTAAADVAATRQAGEQSVADMRKAAADVLRESRAQGATRIAQQGKAGRAEVRSIGERARAATAAAVAKQERLQGSSVMRSSVSGQVADIMRAVTLGTGSWFGNLSILRLVNGPKGDDLLEWAAYSTQNTQRLTQALMGQMPDRAVSMLLRDAGFALQQPSQSSVQNRPPARATAAGPMGR